MSITGEIKSIFLEKGKNHFDEGSVTQLSHALQCAQHAEIADSSVEMITACLLHDIGHLLNKDARQAIRNGEGAEHENIAVNYLRSWFGPRRHLSNSLACRRKTVSLCNGQNIFCKTIEGIITSP